MGGQDNCIEGIKIYSGRVEEDDLAYLKGGEKNRIKGLYTVIGETA